MAFLDGIRVVEIGAPLAVQFAGQILADYGAAVVRVDHADGDPIRDAGAVGLTESDAGYRALNAGKAVVDLDPRREDDLAALGRLAAAADVLVSGVRPASLGGLGLDRDRLAASNPGLIHCALSPWGQTGPYRDRGGQDITFMAAFGGLGLSGAAAAPTFAFPPTAEHTAGLQAASAVCAALAGRTVGGVGAFLDVAIGESVLPWLTIPLNEVLSGVPEDRRSGVLTGGAACYQIYRTRDSRYLAVGATDRKTWVAVCNALGRPEWIPRQWERLPQRSLIGEVGDVVRTRTLPEWWSLLHGLDCGCEPLWRLDEMPSHPQISARGLLSVEMKTPRVTQILPPVRIDDAAPKTRPKMRVADAYAVLADWGLTAVPEDEAADA